MAYFVRDRRTNILSVHLTNYKSNFIYAFDFSFITDLWKKINLLMKAGNF